VQAAILALDVVRLVGLRRERLTRALSQRELAQKANISFSTVARIERGAPAHPSTIRKLADALGCAPTDLMEKLD
jgi:transcriptional regulator with XRE-family HTH domain